MTSRQRRVTFEPTGRTVFVLPGTTVLEAAGRAGLAIDTPCGGVGTCTKCRVQLMEGVAPANVTEEGAFAAAELSAGWRLACQTRVGSDCRVVVPDGSLFAGQPQILTTAETDEQRVLLPSVRKGYVELSEPTLADDAADLERLERALGQALKIDVALLRELPRRLRRDGFRGTAVMADHRLIDWEPGDTAAECYGVAFDVGTTTIVGALLDLYSGHEMAVVSRLNPQVSFGDDVLARINHSRISPESLDDLHHAVVRELGRMLDDLCAKTRVPAQRIYHLAFAGNTTMEHLLCRIDPSQLGELPFVPVYSRGLRFPARELSLRVNRQASAYVFPVIGGFVGGDTVAGMLATQLLGRPGPTLMVDIGTNGEIVLAHEGRLCAASTAAGPAFEGARISCGMRATRGAIEKVVLNDELRCSVIGDVLPVGLCGSGLIDLVAELRRVGVVTSRGRLLPPDDLPATLPEALRRRVRVSEGQQTEFILSSSHRGQVNGDVVLTQRDVRELQLAAGSIRAGIRILLKRAGLEARDLQSVLIAGGFGSFIRRNHAQRLGLLPPDMDHRRLLYVGNVSLSGAKWALQSTEARSHAEHLARITEHVELSRDPEFQMEFADAMIFPEAH